MSLARCIHVRHPCTHCRIVHRGNQPLILLQTCIQSTDVELEHAPIMIYLMCPLNTSRIPFHPASPTLYKHQICQSDNTMYYILRIHDYGEVVVRFTVLIFVHALARSVCMGSTFHASMQLIIRRTQFCNPAYQ